MDRKLLACILANDQSEDHQLWVQACKDFSDTISYDVINFTAYDWHEKITKRNYDFLLAKPPGIQGSIKQIYDERIHIIDRALNIPIFPLPQEIYIYENKRYLYSWLKANNLPHPKTHIFYSEKEAVSFIEETIFPKVAKTNIGASGSGVVILYNRKDAAKYINRCFSDKGAPRRWGPNLSKGGLLKRGFHYILNPSEIRRKTLIYKAVKKEKQKGFVILQNYIAHDYEWRIVVIGDSYFAHKKLKIGEMSSGSLLKQYDKPPLKLFDFAKSIMDNFNFTSQAIDLFETEEGDLLINEMQCIFGQSDPYQMLVDGKPGRYQFADKKWVFEEGDFTSNQCYNLRLDYILNLLK
jgi:glutathione synthase/RimK-type ligase-like ATP-grasp enzyme